MNLGLAFKIFFRTLSNSETAANVSQLLSGNAPAIASEPQQPVQPKPVPAKPARSEAISLLATLQREARLIDFLQEKLDSYSDAQIGAAVRDVQRDSAAVLERLYAIRPASETAEGESMTLEPGFSATRYRLTGNVEGEGPFTGSVAHQGWEATKCDTPSWQGTEADAKVLAPIEIEVE